MATLPAAPLDKQAEPPDPYLPVDLGEAFLIVNRNTHIHITPDRRALSSKIQAARGLNYMMSMYSGKMSTKSSDTNMTNLKAGDPYVRVDDGYARLPGAGYEALHP